MRSALRLGCFVGIIIIPSIVAPRVMFAQGSDSLPKPFEALSRTILAGRDSLVHLTRDQIGLRYKYGAKQPGLAFDCSSLVQWIAGLFGRDLPRTAAEQSHVGVEVPRDTSRLLPGDLLFFGKGKRVTHIGIYVGEGKYVHAANRRKGVIESALVDARKSWWKGARRIWVDPDSAFAPAPEITLPKPDS